VAGNSDIRVSDGRLYFFSTETNSFNEERQ
jgi:hypothetical protein